MKITGKVNKQFTKEYKWPRKKKLACHTDTETKR